MYTLLSVGIIICTITAVFSVITAIVYGVDRRWRGTSYGLLAAVVLGLASWQMIALSLDYNRKQTQVEPEQHLAALTAAEQAYYERNGHYTASLADLRASYPPLARHIGVTLDEGQRLLVSEDDQGVYMATLVNDNDNGEAYFTLQLAEGHIVRQDCDAPDNSACEDHRWRFDADSASIRREAQSLRAAARTEESR